MAKLDFYYDTKKVNEDIENWRDLEIEVNFDDEIGQGVVKAPGTFSFTGELAAKINEWNALGLVGGPGIFEAPPFRVEVCGSNNIIFQGGINTAACETLYECDKVVAPLRHNGINFVNDIASSFSFAYLASISRITEADYVSVPYVINSIPDYVNIMLAGISLYIMIKELGEILEKAQSLVSELIGDAGVATGSASITPVAIAYAVGRVLVDVVRIIFYILYLVIIVVAIIDLIKMILDNLIQPVKYKKGMRARDSWIKAAQYVGYNFSSTIYSGAHFNDVIIPRKTATQGNPRVIQSMLGIGNISHKDYDDAKNPSSTGFFDGTFADFILAEEARLNGQMRVIGNTIYFETEAYYALYANYTLPNIKRKNGDPHGTNACELASNYKISYAIDDQDNNTYDQYEGTSAQMILTPRTILNQRNILLKNFTEVNLIYALAKRKESLNGVEEAISFLYTIAGRVYDVITNFANTILKTINKILNAIAFLTKGNPPQIPLIPSWPPNPIAARIGMMLLSSDFIGVPKVLVIDSSGKLASNNQSLTSAANLMDELHFVNFAVRFVTTKSVPTNDHNQWLTYTDKEIPFCCADYEAVLYNNYIKTYDQKIAKVKSLVWNPYKETARITYWVKEKYTTNFNQTYLLT